LWNANDAEVAVVARHRDAHSAQSVVEARDARAEPGKWRIGSQERDAAVPQAQQVRGGQVSAPLPVKGNGIEIRLLHRRQRNLHDSRRGLADARSDVP
jgi:hypothetical protein